MTNDEITAAEIEEWERIQSAAVDRVFAETGHFPGCRVSGCEATMCAEARAIRAWARGLPASEWKAGR